MMKYLILAFLWSSLAFLVQGQRTPTISHISASMRIKQGGTIEMDCSTLYATEYPILWVKLPGHDCSDRKNYDFRSPDADPCTPVPLSSGSALIVRDNRFRYNKWLYFVYCTTMLHVGAGSAKKAVALVALASSLLLYIILLEWAFLHAC